MKTPLTDRREESSHRSVPIAFCLKKIYVWLLFFELVRLHLGKVEKRSEREAQTDPRRQKVILRLIYNIVSDV
jgi:hypothetical protein